MPKTHDVTLTLWPM